MSDSLENRFREAQGNFTPEQVRIFNTMLKEPGKVWALPMLIEATKLTGDQIADSIWTLIRFSFLVLTADRKLTLGEQ